MTAAELLAAIEVERLTLGPDDTLVFKVKRRMSADELDRLTALVQEQFPGVRVLVVEDDVELTVVSAADSPGGGQ